MRVATDAELAEAMRARETQTSFLRGVYDAIVLPEEDGGLWWVTLLMVPLALWLLL